MAAVEQFQSFADSIDLSWLSLATRYALVLTDRQKLLPILTSKGCSEH